MPARLRSIPNPPEGPGSSFLRGRHGGSRPLKHLFTLQVWWNREIHHAFPEETRIRGQCPFLVGRDSMFHLVPQAEETRLHVLNPPPIRTK